MDYTGWSNASNGVFHVNLAGVTGQKTPATYSTFFHETSHCIDYYLGSEKDFTASYRDGNTDLSLQNVLENVVEFFIRLMIILSIIPVILWSSRRQSVHMWRML